MSDAVPTFKAEDRVTLDAIGLHRRNAVIELIFAADDSQTRSQLESRSLAELKDLANAVSLAQPEALDRALTSKPDPDPGRKHRQKLAALRQELKKAEHTCSAQLAASRRNPVDNTAQAWINGLKKRINKAEISLRRAEQQPLGPRCLRVDPETAAIAAAAGAGATGISVHVGGKSHQRLGPPLPMKVDVLSVTAA